MDNKELEALLQTELLAVNVDVVSEGNHYSVTVISEAFKGLNAVKRQQLVYAVLNEKIASGEIHAVNMRLYAPGEEPA